MRRAYRVALPLVLVILAALAALPPLSGGCSPRSTAPEPAVAAATSPVSPAPVPSDDPLEALLLGVLGTEPVTRPLRTDEAHRYRLDLAAGDYAHVLVEQLGADVTIAFHDPSGRPLIEIDTPTFAGTDGDEHLHLQARRTGAHHLVVRAIDDLGEDSRYRARLVVRRLAAGDDLRRVRAEEWYQRGCAMHRVENDLAAAEPLLARAARGFAALADDRLRADAEHERCTALFGLARYDEALEACRRALAVYDPSGPAWRRATTLHLLGNVEATRGDPGRAIEWYRKSLPIKRELGNPRSLALLLDELARAHQELRAYHEALTAFDEALAIWRSLGRSGRAAAVLHARGHAYLELGRTAQAEADFRAALGLPDRDERDHADTLTALGVTLVERGDPHAALPLLEQALEIRIRGGDDGDTAETLASLGLARCNAGQETEAIELYRRALPLAETAGKRALVGHLHHNLAWMATDRGSAGAIPLFHRALAEYRRAGDRQAEVRTLLGLARAERARGRYEVALHHLELAVLIVTELRDRLDRHDLRVAYMARRYDLYDFAVDLLMEIHRRHPGQGWDARALEMSGRARGRGLLDLLNELGIDPRRGVDPELLEREQRLQGRRYAAAARLRRLRDAGGAPAGRLAAAERELQEVTDELRNLGAEVRRRSPAFASLSEPEVLDVTAIQSRLLGPDDVLLEYKLGADRSYLWTVSADSLDSFQLPGRGELAELALALNDQVGRPPRIGSSPALDRALAGLSRALLCPARERLDRRRLIVIAEGELLYVPFAALSLEPCGGPPKPLAAGHEIVTAPSASALAALRRRTRKVAPSLTLAVVADPVFSRCDPRLSPARRADACPKAPPWLRYSGEEAHEILELVPPSRRIAALGFDAHRRALLDDRLGGARYVHLATHIVTREQPPRLVLSRVDRRGRPLAGGDLFAHEIAELDLDADLVVLSGCDSGLGEPIRGEGLVGLAQGFFRAGAGGVLVSLWPVDDRATASLMTAFYRLLLHEELTPAAALARAQREIAAQPRWQSPYYWAGFVLVGDGEPAAGSVVEIAGLAR
jgi:CHAT domain-containing protein/Tfp pilus assembly protein PilF